MLIYRPPYPSHSITIFISAMITAPVLLPCKYINSNVNNKRTESLFSHDNRNILSLIIMVSMERNALHNLNIGQILNLIDIDVRRKVRKLEKLNTKCIKLKCAIIFNDTHKYVYNIHTYITRMHTTRMHTHIYIY